MLTTLSVPCGKGKTLWLPTQHSDKVTTCFEKSVQFAAEYDLDVAADKSWLFSTGPEVRKALKARGRAPVAHRAVDLGSQMAYSQHKANAKCKKRMEAAVEGSSRLSRLPGPFTDRELLAKTNLLAKALYGSEVVPLPQVTLDSLRRAIANAVFGERNGIRDINMVLDLARFLVGPSSSGLLPASTYLSQDGGQTHIGHYVASSDADGVTMSEWPCLSAQARLSALALGLR